MAIREQVSSGDVAGVLEHPPGTVAGRHDAPPASPSGVSAISGGDGPGAGPLPPDQATSSYLQYLPSIYQGDPFIGRFLMIFESILAPIERQIDAVADTLDPHLAPAELLSWIASWVGVELDGTWPLDRQRELIARAAALYRWRGTRRGLREHLRVYAGRPPLIVESFTGLRLGQDAALGLNARLGAPAPNTIAVTVLADHPEAVDEQALRRIVEQEKPAHAGYTLEVLGTAPPA
jgi:phage tail-like protein